MKSQQKYLLTQCFVTLLDIAGMVIGPVSSMAISPSRIGPAVIAAATVIVFMIGLFGIWTKKTAFIRWNLWTFCTIAAVVGYFTVDSFLSEGIGTGIACSVGLAVAGSGVACCHYLYEQTPKILKIEAKVADHSTAPMESASTPKEIQVHSFESRQRASPTKTQLHF